MEYYLPATMWNVDLVTFNHMVKSQEQVSSIKEQFAKKTKTVCYCSYKLKSKTILVFIALVE